MELTSSNVQGLYNECSNIVSTPIIKASVFLHLQNFEVKLIKLYRNEIESMIMQLPLSFRLSRYNPANEVQFTEDFFKILENGESINHHQLSSLYQLLPGASFLDMHLTKNNVIWGDPYDMECLLLLGKCIGKMDHVIPHQFSSYLDCKIPRIMILDGKIKDFRNFMENFYQRVRDFESRTKLIAA